jgi:FkbM family methyltransferase
MSVRYLTGNEKILEIGGNIGRNSLIISSILKDSSNLVVLESNKEIADQLEENKLLNGFNFNIEKSALSKRKLIQKDWVTKVSDTLEDGYNFVNTITLNELNKKYNLQFDTLILDCEGSFYYILYDFPEILENVNLIIIENDYINVFDKKHVEDILIKNNFYRNYIQSGGYYYLSNNFYEVWIKSK